MAVTRTIARAAINKFLDTYANRGWTLDTFLQAWDTAHRAANENTAVHYEAVYNVLRRWKAFRPQGPKWSSEETFRVLCNLGSDLCELRLTSLTQEHTAQIWNAIWSLRGIKQLKNGPSLVAVSKTLHLWNPKLFVIADRKFICEWMWMHGWVKEGIESVHAELESALPEAIGRSELYASQLGTYLAFLFWCSRLMLGNPEIQQAFVDYLDANARVAGMGFCREYEAVACEWFLLGVVDLPPVGLR